MINAKVVVDNNNLDPFQRAKMKMIDIKTSPSKRLKSID